MRSEFKHWVPVTVRFRDMDAMGHVNSAVYLTYFEIARMWYFQASGLEGMKVKGKIGPAVVSQTCNYRQQVFFPAELEAGIRTTGIGTKSFSVAYEFYLRGTDTLVADGVTVMTWVDYEVARAIPVPETLRRNLEALEGRSFEKALA